MGDIVKVTVNADGDVTSYKGPGAVNFDSRPVETENTTPPAESLHKQGGIVTKWSEAEGMTYSKPQSATVSLVPTEHGVSAIENGSPVPLDAAGPKATVTLPGMGDSSAEVWANLGYLKRSPSGQGYIVNEAMLPKLAGEAAVKKAEEPTDAPEVAKDQQDDNVVSMEGVEPTSPANDIVHGQLRTAAGPALYQALVSSAILGTDPAPHIADLASRTGQPVEHVSEAVMGVMADFQKAARQIFTANGGRGGSGFEAMLQWAQENGKADAAIDALQSLVEHHEAGPLARLSRQYTRLNKLDFSVAEVLGASLGDGVRTYAKDGVAWVSIKGREDMTFASAVARGLVRISGGGVR